MRKTIKQTFSLLMLCLLLFIFMFGAVGCSPSYNGEPSNKEEPYNEGYKKLYDFVKKNNSFEFDGSIQYSKRVGNFYFIFTGTDKGSGILVSVYTYDTKGTSSINFTIEKKGISEDNFLTVEILTPKVSAWYYKGTTLIKSIYQSSFTIFGEKRSSEENGYYADVSSSLIPTLDTLLELIVEDCLRELYNFVENDVGIPMKEFETT